MKKILFLLLSFSVSLTGIGQTTNAKLIDLAKAYNNFMFRNEPPKSAIKDLRSDVPDSLKATVDFIAQTITTGNDLLKKKYLTLPDASTLKNIYIVGLVDDNITSDSPIDNNKLIDSAKYADASTYELTASYYRMLFTAIGNKDLPFDFSGVDFVLKDYNLSDDTQKAIFFLECMNYCGREIWGYMNIVKPANTRKAYEYIKKFPQFNELPYYQYTDLNFPDFETDDKGEDSNSYKTYYLNQYYNLLLSHLVCLKAEGAGDKAMNDLLLGSILKDRNLYKYSKNKDVLEILFKRIQ
jgi:hypothetical protein